MINIGRLVTNPKFCTKFTIVTKTGTWEKGAFVTTETENISYSLFLNQTRWMMQQRTQKRPDRSSLICPV